MKRLRILRLFSIAIVLSLLALAVPVMPALGVNTVTLNPTQGPIGRTVTVTGDALITAYRSNNTTPPTYDSFAQIYFAEDNVLINNLIDTNVKTYLLVSEALVDETTGDFTADFTVPSRLDGYASSTFHDDVRPGTYYVYVTFIKYYTDNVVENKTIKFKSTFTVTASPTINPLSPATGPAGAAVIISGSTFLPNSPVVIRFGTGTTNLSPTLATDGTGSFSGTITIPSDATPSTTPYNISVATGTTTKTATFTVTASATLNPLTIASGPAGTQVPISGTNFPAGTIAITFDGSLLTVTGSTQTSGGSFSSFITIPPNATATTHIIMVTVGAVSVSTNFTVTSSALLNSPDPASGPAGTEVTLSGTNFPVGVISVTFDGSPVTVSGSIQTTGGSFSSKITVPEGSASGDHTIAVTVGAITLSAVFTVTGAPTPTATPTPTPTPTTGINIVQNDFNVGAPIGIGGAGFAAGSTVTIKYGGVTRATAEVESNGTFQVIFEIPEILTGARQFIISDGINTTTANFVVETTAPAEPSLISPDPGVKIKIPVTFDWDDVTDASLPVTYDFQIATEEDFNADSIILEKNSLTDSIFMLTEAEGLELASDNATYFWRVKSVDGALNESDWSAASDFLASGPSVFPRWALILIIVFGSIFVFGVGFFIGRRTAYYY